MESQRWHTELVEDAATAKEEQQNQGAGFKIQFDPKNSSVYDPTKSSTFKVVPNQVRVWLASMFFNHFNSIWQLHLF